MSKRKALSHEEKRAKLLELLHESGDVFQLKDLERLAPQLKGIVQQSVKGILEELVDGGEAASDKISGICYYWAFPGHSLNIAEQRLRQCESVVAQAQSQLQALEARWQEVAGKQEDATKVKVLDEELTQLRQERIALEEQLQTLSGGSDSEKIMARELDSKRILEAANRWTDNIYTIKSWVKRKFEKDGRELDKAFGIHADLDYLDDM